MVPAQALGQQIAGEVEISLARGCLPIGLAHGVRLTRDIAEGESVGWADVEIGDNDEAVRVRRELEAAFKPRLAAE